MRSPLINERMAAARGAAWVLDAIASEGVEVVMARQMEILAFLRDEYGHTCLPQVSTLPKDRSETDVIS